MSKRWKGGFVGGPSSFDPLGTPTTTTVYDIWYWGDNGAGNSGTNDTTSRSSPVQVTAGIPWNSFSTCGCYVKSDGTLWAWGGNSYGQLGLGDVILRSSPVQVGALTNWSRVYGQFHWHMAVKTDGTLWSWGHNYWGVLGQSDEQRRSSPTQVGSDTNWSSASELSCSAHRVNAFAIKTNGTLWSWGRNSYGSLGTGDTNRRSSPVQVGALTNWSKIVGCSREGYSHTIAVKTDGTLWSWGHGGLGQLGLGNTSYYSSPKQVGALTTWSIPGGDQNGNSASGRTSFGLATDGTLWAWGENNEGQLGRNNRTNYTSPVQVDGTWLDISSAYKATAGLKSDGTLWTWGRNAWGELGDNTTINRSSPVQVGTSTTWSKVKAGGSFTVGLG